MGLCFFMESCFSPVTGLWSGATTTTFFSTFPRRDEGEVVDFRRDWPPNSSPTGHQLERKLRSWLGSTSTWVQSSTASWTGPRAASALLKKGNQRLYLMKKLKSFNVCPKLLEVFYRSAVESVVTFNSLCHFGSLKEQDKANCPRSPRLLPLRLIGRPVPHLQALFEAKAIKRLEAIHGDPTHPLCTELKAHTSARSGRLIHSSFLPAAVRLCDAWSDRVNWNCVCCDSASLERVGGWGKGRGRDRVILVLKLSVC